MEKICLATIVNVKGLKGEVKIKTFTRSPLSILDYPLILENDQGLKIVSAYEQKNLVIAKIQNINTIEQAQQLVGESLYTLKSNMPDLEDEDEFYHVDLIGLKVVDKNMQEIGKILAVQNFGDDDILEILFNETQKSELITFTDDNFPNVNINDGYIVMTDITYLNYTNDTKSI